MRKIGNPIKDFLRLETASSILLLVAALLAMVIQNSGWSYLYEGLISTPVEIRIGEFHLGKPLLLWINDGLMAIFFLLVGLELKRELLEGELSTPKKVILPAAGAVGGMLFPSLIYTIFNYHDPVTKSGWAIPAATDIAFAMGALATFGSRLPSALKIFLLSLAIIDDLLAIVVIAVFYSGNLSLNAGIAAAVLILLLALVRRAGVLNLTPYIFLGLLLWTAVLKSGIHATLAGVVLALFIPNESRSEHEETVLKTLEHDLHPIVAYFILPIFAFANSGISFSGVSLATVLEPVSLGIIAGLFLGKQLGVYLFARLAVLSGLAELPSGLNWRHIYGVSILCGIGFTMSLFIGSLAFEHVGPGYETVVRLGIVVGSALSGIAGILFLRTAITAEEERGE